MKIYFSLCVAVVLLTSCSSPRYSYYFDHQKYREGKMTNEAAGNEMTILVVDRQQMVASGDVRTVVPLSVLEERTARQTNIEQTLSKPQQRTGLSQWRKEIKMTLKASNKLNRESLAPGSMDKDLKRAILFGAVGLVALIIGGNAFQVIGGLSLLIGLVFLIKWLVRQ